MEQDARVSRDFLRAVRQGRGNAFLARLDLDALERRLAERELGIRAPPAPGLRALG